MVAANGARGEAEPGAKPHGKPRLRFIADLLGDMQDGQIRRLQQLHGGRHAHIGEQ